MSQSVVHGMGSCSEMPSWCLDTVKQRNERDRLHLVPHLIRAHITVNLTGYTRLLSRSQIRALCPPPLSWAVHLHALRFRVQVNHNTVLHTFRSRMLNATDRRWPLQRCAVTLWLIHPGNSTSVPGRGSNCTGSVRAGTLGSEKLRGWQALMATERTRAAARQQCKTVWRDT